MVLGREEGVMTWAERYRDQAAAWRIAAQNFRALEEWADVCRRQAEAAERLAAAEQEREEAAA